MMIDWLLQIDWSWLFGDGGFIFAVEILIPAAIQSVTGVSSGFKYAEVVWDSVLNPGGARTEVGVAPFAAFAALPENGIALNVNGKIYFGTIQIHADGPTFVNGDVTIIACKPLTGKVWLGKLGSGYYAGGDPAADTNPTATLSPGTFHVAAGIAKDGGTPTGGAQFTIRTANAQFTGTKPVGSTSWSGV